MALTTSELKLVKKEIEEAGRPLVFYDDDADGLASFLLVHKQNPDALGIRAARGPELDVEFLRKVNENQPDLVVILDKPRVDKEFFTECKTPTIWIDHHDPSGQEPHKWGVKNLTYLNPRLHDEKDATPVAYWIWKALGGPMWIAATGVTADWNEKLLDEFSDEYPEFAPKERTIQDALYRSKLGVLVRVFNFVLKGRAAEVRKCVNAIGRVEKPEEILKQETPRGKFLWRHYLPVLEEYERQYLEARKGEVADGLYVHVFSGLRTSLVAEVANEIMIAKDAHIVIVGRRVNEEVKFSMRSLTKNLPPIVEKALGDVQGYGGGHKEACGGAIRADDWERFVEAVKKQI